MANALNEYLGGTSPGNSLIPMLRGNAMPDEVERLRVIAMNEPDEQRRNMLLAAIEHNRVPDARVPDRRTMFEYTSGMGGNNPQMPQQGMQQAQPTPSDVAKMALMEKLRGTQNVPQEDFNSSALDALYDPATGTFRSGGAVRDNQTGKVTALGGGAPRQQGPVISYGVGNGGITQLKDSGGMPEADYSRVQVTIPGLGKGHYSTDGAYVVGEYDNGVRWKALLGYDHAATQQAKADSMGMEKLRLGNEKTQAEINNLNLKPASPEKRVTLTEVLDPKDPTRMLRVDANVYNGGTLGDTGVFGISGAVKRDEKPLTDAQSKALLFGNRMAAAEDIFGKLANEGVNTSIPGSRAPIVGGLINALQPESRQQLDQAKRDFINATLRRESGAVISDAEFDNAEKQYFPQVGDGAKVIEQKKQNRQLARRSIDMEVPEASRGKGRTEQQAQAVNPGEAIFDAKKAIAAGKDRVWIVKKLESMGITNHGL